MTSSNNQPQKQYGVYRVTGQGSGGFSSGGLKYDLIEGPYTNRQEAIHKADELNKSEPEVALSYVVSEYKGKS